MNRRQKKKLAKKRELFVVSFAKSYREVKENDRAYHEFVIESQRFQRLLKKRNVKLANTFQF